MAKYIKVVPTGFWRKPTKFTSLKWKTHPCEFRFFGVKGTVFEEDEENMNLVDKYQSDLNEAGS